MPPIAVLQLFIRGCFLFILIHCGRGYRGKLLGSIFISSAVFRHVPPFFIPNFSELESTPFPSMPFPTGVLWSVVPFHPSPNTQIPATLSHPNLMAPLHEAFLKTLSPCLEFSLLPAPFLHHAPVSTSCYMFPCACPSPSPSCGLHDSEVWLRSTPVPSVCREVWNTVQAPFVFVT